MTRASEAEGESEWFVSQEANIKAQFLAILMHELTIAGRNSYRVASDELDKPSQLRVINEVQHRVAGCMRGVLSGQATESIQWTMPILVLEHQDNELRALLSYAWHNAKKQIS
jgi:hypothetical protein